MTATKLIREPFETGPAATAGSEVTRAVLHHQIKGALTTQPIHEELLLATLGDARLRVVVPIRVKLSKDQEQFVAVAPDFEEFGQGDNRSEAVADLQLSLAELFHQLSEHADRLGRDLQSVWERLSNHVQKRG